MTKLISVIFSCCALLFASCAEPPLKRPVSKLPRMQKLPLCELSPVQFLLVVTESGGFRQFEEMSRKDGNFIFLDEEYYNAQEMLKTWGVNAESTLYADESTALQLLLETPWPLVCIHVRDDKGRESWLRLKVFRPDEYNEMLKSRKKKRRRKALRFSSEEPLKAALAAIEKLPRLESSDYQELIIE